MNLYTEWVNKNINNPNRVHSQEWTDDKTIKLTSFDKETRDGVVATFKMSTCENIEGGFAVGGVVSKEYAGTAMVYSETHPHDFALPTKDVQKLYNYIEDKEISKKCLLNALKKCTYTTKDLLDDVSRIWNDENISEEFKDFLIKAIAGGRNSNNVQQIASTPKSELCSRIERGISALTNLGFDISYDRKTNKLSIKNMEHITELNGESAEQTNRLREKAEKIINNATSDVKEIDDIFGNKND